jgi:nonribosomal peptide synthetase DhbF
MAASYIDAIQTEQPRGPYHLLGYSSGGLLAFEMAHQLKARGEEVAFVALLDTTLPDPRMERTASHEMVVLDMASSLGVADMLSRKRKLPSLSGLVEMAREAGRLPDDFEVVHVERMADVMRNTVRTYPDYRLRVWDGSMLLIRAMRRTPDGGPPADWSPYVSGPLEVVDLDCSHPNLIAPEMVATVAEAIAKSLASGALRKASLTLV